MSMAEHRLPHTLPDALIDASEVSFQMKTSSHRNLKTQRLSIFSIPSDALVIIKLGKINDYQ